MAGALALPLPLVSLQCGRMAVTVPRSCGATGSATSLWRGLVQTELLKDRMEKDGAEDPV